MEKKFKFWKFLGALFLPFLIFVLMFGIAMMVHTRLFYSFCTGPFYEEPNSTFLCFLSIILFIAQLFISILIIRRSRNKFITIGFIISILITAVLFHSPVRARINYKKSMMNLSNWKKSSEQDNMVGYFISHDVYIGKTYKQVVADLGNPIPTKIPGKYVYEISGGIWMYELFFENDKCIKQELYCIGFGSTEEANYNQANF